MKKERNFRSFLLFDRFCELTGRIVTASPKGSILSGTANQCTATMGADIYLYFLFPVFLFLLDRLDMHFASLGIGYVCKQYRFSQTVQQRGIDHLLLIGANQTIEVYSINQRLGDSTLTVDSTENTTTGIKQEEGSSRRSSNTFV